MVTRIQGFMGPIPISLRGSFSNSLLYHFPCKITQKFLSGRLRRLSNVAIARAFDEFSVEEHEKESINMYRPKGLDILNLMEKRGMQANHQTYLWLLEGCLKSGSLVDAKRLHGKILKSGFNGEHVISCRLVDVYVTHGDLDDAFQVFDDFPERNVSDWNRLISIFAQKKLTRKVLGLFSRMLEENVNPDEITFAHILRASFGDKVSFRYVEQIHAKFIYLGFGTSPIVCNPLIDLYSKNGFVDSAKLVFGKLSSRDSVSWVAMISGLSQNGCEEEAILLYLDMHISGIIPTPYIFSSVISACTKIGLFKLGEQLHALIYKLAFASEIYVCNALVTLYSCCEDFISAEQIFTKMQCRDEVSYNSLISGLAQRGLSERALQLFEKMQLDSLKPDCVTVASIVSACASVGGLHKGKQLHAYAIKAGIYSDIVIEGSLLDLYVKCSDVETAREFFLTTQKENIVLWNMMLVAYGQIGDLSKSFQIFIEMQNEGLIPNQYTYPSILRTCTSVGALDLGEQIHTQVIKTGFQPNVYVCSVLIDMYSKHEKLDTAHKIFRRLNEVDVVSWTTMIAGYARHDLFFEALKLFEEMQDQGIRSDNIGFSSAISACTGIQSINQGQQIHAQSIVSGYTLDLSVGNALVCLYARCGRIKDAYLAFDKIISKDDISWNGLISGFAQSGHCEEALKMFSQMNQAGVEPNMFTFGSAVSAAANIANIKQGKQVHARIIKMGYDIETEASNVLITLYAKCGSLDDAKREFLEMPEKNEVSWNAMITGYSQHGCGMEAIELFEEMKRLQVMPNHVTFVGVLSACSHVGLVDKGLNYFKTMKDEHGLVPKPEHYVCVVDILGRAGLLQRARKFIEGMPIEPDAMVWRTLLSACTVHKNMEVGEFAACRLLELEPEDSASYVLLSNMYAVAGKWDRRDSTRQVMKERGVKKEPGCSWIEVKNSIHTFFVGDRLHPLADKIYEFLDDLNKRAAAVGYTQDRSSLLNETEYGKKDPAVYTHSEKLAISFGLLTLSNTMPIRVMKNLRVCNDCHNWIKFVSKISNRAIVVRDGYRFHHFKGGACSCKDFW
ncbi:pentatricopeptide repeat-containing protein At4g13650 [Actinidia eriantha]|uniref:pentatricopeptide repeat-containing protein At4g13650 n=1 Tax=Actinidia eriantha TaxID=165200 RepID=UPI00258FB89C|nr:pentatricopeptide repeat-containing protein At4g13650 [Actinidia eriantha]